MVECSGVNKENDMEQNKRIRLEVPSGSPDKPLGKEAAVGCEKEVELLQSLVGERIGRYFNSKRKTRRTRGPVDTVFAEGRVEELLQEKDKKGRRQFVIKYDDNYSEIISDTVIWTVLLHKYRPATIQEVCHLRGDVPLQATTVSDSALRALKKRKFPSEGVYEFNEGDVMQCSDKKSAEVRALLGDPTLVLCQGVRILDVEHHVRYLVPDPEANSFGVYGLCATHTIPPHSFICEYAGELEEESDAEDLSGNLFSRSFETGTRTLELFDRLVINASKKYNVGVLGNDGLNMLYPQKSIPNNCEYELLIVDGVPRAFIKARALIQEGQELFIDYGPAWWNKFMLHHLEHMWQHLRKSHKEKLSRQLSDKDSGSDEDVFARKRSYVRRPAKDVPVSLPNLPFQTAKISPDGERILTSCLPGSDQDENSLCFLESEGGSKFKLSREEIEKLISDFDSVWRQKQFEVFQPIHLKSLSVPFVKLFAVHVERPQRKVLGVCVTETIPRGIIFGEIFGEVVSSQEFNNKQLKKSYCDQIGRGNVGAWKLAAHLPPDEKSNEKCLFFMAEPSSATSYVLDMHNPLNLEAQNMENYVNCKIVEVVQSGKIRLFLHSRTRIEKDSVLVCDFGSEWLNRSIHQTWLLMRKSFK